MVACIPPPACPSRAPGTHRAGATPPDRSSCNSCANGGRFPLHCTALALIHPLVSRPTMSLVQELHG
eukprot:9485838-Pyramimonas_sp.AAC.1